MLRGIDVSHYQGAVDWAGLKRSHGIAWGAAKATEAEGGRDSRFPANWKGMKDAGLVRAAYSYAHPDNNPADDAQAFLSYVGASGIGPEDIMVCDMEVNDLKLPLFQVRDWLAGWADIVTRETGRKPFLYCGAGFIRNNATKDLKPHYAAWWFPQYPYAYAGKTIWPGSISGYPSSSNWDAPPDIWQFSQSFGGKNMDANVADMTLDDLKTRGRADTPPVEPPTKPPVTPPKTTETEMTEAEYEAYNARLYGPAGTLGVWHAQEVAYRAAHLAALEAQTAALQNLADALKPKV